MTLDQLEIGKPAIITKVNGNGILRSRLLEMGLIPETIVEVVKTAPLKDPIEITLRSYVLTIRLEEAQLIEVQEVN
ncbi:MAG TPA: FeoA family protein [Erysipelotrichaceae bacterium]|jgi:ferrous iron transport protein A|nr:ferrous iron transport protein A [Erysipelotrichia bacterium]HPX32957.1 FeoA family protein [Erysipelotrichaceae bacterium]HQA85495.1 FeoA family protein [Erysipelotrichaceae bacterium]